MIVTCETTSTCAHHATVMLRRLAGRDWQVVIGIESHAQIKSRHKLFFAAQKPRSLSEFCSCCPRCSFPWNSLCMFSVCFYCCAHFLQTLNPSCVDLALRTAIALQCSIQPHSSFDRKHYFYSDLPLGYQITQQYGQLSHSPPFTLSLSS